MGIKVAELNRPFAGAESGSPGRALEAGKRGSPGRAVQAGIRGKRLNKQINSTFTFKNIDEIIVKKTINNLPTKNSCGYDDVSSKLLKVIAPVIIKPLTLLINQVLNTGLFPDKLKIAKVIPIYKKGDPQLFENYRPISLLPTISKVLEKIIHKQLSSYFDEYGLFFPNQYGFRPKHSTEYAALELIDRIINEMDKNEIPIDIFLDLSKAFDTIIIRFYYIS